jgi:hypothetical protein
MPDPIPMAVLGRLAVDQTWQGRGLGAALDALLDQTLVRVDAETYAHYLSVLDKAPGGAGYKRLMKAAKPWKA